MKLGLSLLGRETAASIVAETAQAAERAGLSSVWIGEYHRNAYVAAAAAAIATERIEIGTAVALAFPRSPLTTAMSALDLDELSGERFTLGLGSQVRGIIERWYDQEFSHPAARLGEYCRAVRHAMHADPGEFNGRFYSMDLAGFDRPNPARVPPIYLAALKPMMVRTAALNADGILGHMLWSNSYFDRIVTPQLAEAPADFRRCVSVIFAMGENRDTARRDARRTVGFYAATGAYADVIEGDGFEQGASAARTALKSRDFDALERAVDDAMLDTYAISGTIDEVADLLADRRLRYDLTILVDAHVGTRLEQLREYHDALFGAADKLHRICEG